MLAQSDLKDLGCHTEVLVDSYVDMYEAGVMTVVAKHLIGAEWFTPLLWAPETL